MGKVKFLLIVAFILLVGFCSFGLVAKNAALIKLNAISQEIPQNWWETKWEKKAELQDFINSNLSETALCAQAQYLIAGNYYANKDYNQAIAEYQKLIATYTEEEQACASAQFEIGQIYFYHLNDIPSAILEYQRVLDTHPDSSLCANAQLMIARSLMRQDENDNAWSAYQNLITNYPKSHLQVAFGYRDMGNMCMRESSKLTNAQQKKQKVEESISYLKQAYQTCPLEDEDTELMPFILTDIYKGLKLLDDNLLDANEFIKYQKFGPAGPDKIAGTQDDLIDVLAQF